MSLRNNFELSVHSQPSVPQRGSAVLLQLPPGCCGCDCRWEERGKASPPLVGTAAPDLEQKWRNNSYLPLNFQTLIVFCLNVCSEFSLFESAHVSRLVAKYKQRIYTELKLRWTSITISVDILVSFCVVVFFLSFLFLFFALMQWIKLTSTRVSGWPWTVTWLSFWFAFTGCSVGGIS